MIRILHFLIAFTVFAIVTVAITALLQEMIFFSVFVGLPAGTIAGVVTFIYLRVKDKGQ
ncbi:hypothetical protein J7W08_03840 [Methanococcoides orientis]|uniref:hypothetical protein n=1 Tax=Methanococcoides orientis TaxID=2822137 RepID=UPI001E2C9B62|nr:hypothetical protein [Methanococcoides orientis]UGV41437.1 hypothetical protein J7W08_03840 [Methanococcoides orientis]